MTDLSHLNALELRLSHEREYLRAAKSDLERELREVWVSQIEKEIAHERIFLGKKEPSAMPDLSDDELLAELGV